MKNKFLTLIIGAVMAFCIYGIIRTAGEFLSAKAFADAISLGSARPVKTDTFTTYSTTNQPKGVNWNELVTGVAQSINWTSINFSNNSVNWTSLYISTAQ